MNIADLVLRHAYGRGNEEAISEFPSDRRRSFSELAQRITRLASAMKAQLGLARHDRVAVLSRNRIEYMEVMLACALNGHMVQALNWRLSKIELSEILKTSPPKLVIYDPEFSQDNSNAVGTTTLFQSPPTRIYGFNLLLTF